jgi:DNA-binding XRE family transcriptional regulator
MTDESAIFDALVTSVRDSRLPSSTERRQTREAAKVTIREAAAALGVSPMTYVRWERDEVQPRREHAVQYRQFLDALRTASA